MKISYTVKKEDENKILKDILKNKLYISTRLLTKLKQNNCILVNNNPMHVNYITNENDIIDVNIKDFNNKSFSDKFNTVNKPLDILFEDEYLLIVNKDSNMPVHPSCDNYENTLSNIVAYHLQEQGIYNIHLVTRLDKNTTGICIFAKNEYIQELFIRKKEQVNMVKKYLCIVDGIVEKNHDIIEKPIARKENSIILREVNPKGDYAKTEYIVISKNLDKEYTILEIILHTGRTHQIRVHMGHIGHTLLGDDLYANEYGSKDICKYIKRQALHAYKVSFTHPITNEKIDITAPIPDDMLPLI